MNTYGLPRYKEVNPGLFTVVTFPFLFGVMFADIGHGYEIIITFRFCLLMAGLYMVIFNQKLQNSDSLFKFGLPVRYMVTMMGFFAFYNGWIYNDFISLSFDTFGSCYKLEENNRG